MGEYIWLNNLCGCCGGTITKDGCFCDPIDWTHEKTSSNGQHRPIGNSKPTAHELRALIINVSEGYWIPTIGMCEAMIKKLYN